MGLLTTFGKGARAAGTSVKEGFKTGAKETFRASLMANLMDDGNKSLSQRIGGALGDSLREATFGQMGALGKALTAGGDKSKSGKSPTSGGGVQGQGIKYQQIKTDNVITAINQSSQQIVGALNTMNATQRMGFNAQTNQIQAQAQAMDTLSGYGEDTVIALREIYELLNRQGYSSGSRGGAGGGSSLPSYQGGSTPQAANDNGNSSGVIGDTLLGALAGGVLGAGGALLSGGRKLLGKAGDATAKAGEKILGKAGEKALVKSALKKLPGIGIIAGLAFGVDRLMDGDLLGAGGEVLSGVLGTIPGLGTAASVAVDAGLAARDFGAFGEAGSADAAPVDAEPATGNSSEGTELTKEESLNVIHAFQQQYGRFGSRDEILQFAQSMYPGRKFSKLISTIDKLEKSSGPQSSVTSNVQLASNEILPGMLGSGDYLSQRQQQLDASRQGSEIPTLSGTFGSDTSEGSLRQQEQLLEAAAKKENMPDKIEIQARELVYKADNVTFDVDTLKFLYKTKEEGAAGSPAGPAPAPVNDNYNNQTSGPNQGLGGGGNDAAPLPPPPPSPSTSRMGASMGAFSPSSTGVGELSAGSAKSMGPGGASTGREQAVLDMIAKREGVSGDAGFDMILGDKKGRPGTSVLGKPPKPISQMTLRELYNWQTKMLNNPNNRWNSSAVGSGQFVRTTIFGKNGKGGLLAQMGITPDQWDTIKFDKKFQQQLTLMNFKQNVGDPNADPSQWNMKGLMNQWESFDTRKGFAPLSSNEIGSVRNASDQPISQTSDASPVSSAPSTPALGGGGGADTGAASAASSSSAEAAGGEQGGQQAGASGGGKAKVIESYGGHRPGRPEQRIINLAQQAASKAGMPSVVLTSGKGNWISPSGRAKGQKTTMHSTGLAVDVGASSFKTPEQRHAFIAAAKAGGAGGVGVYKDKSVHIDFGKNRSWNWGDPDKEGFQKALSGGGGNSGGSAPDASPVSSSGGGGESANMGGGATMADSGGGGMSVGGGSNPLASMLGGGGSPFGAIGNMLGGVVGQLSSATSLFSASGAGAAPSTTMNVASAGPLPDRSRREGPSARNPSPGMDDTLADLIKHAFG